MIAIALCAGFFKSTQILGGLTDTLVSGLGVVPNLHALLHLAWGGPAARLQTESLSSSAGLLH